MFALYAVLYGFCFEHRQTPEWTLFYKATITDETLTIKVLSHNELLSSNRP